mgnify:CR=1 FL=1
MFDDQGNLAEIFKFNEMQEYEEFRGAQHLRFVNFKYQAVLQMFLEVYL